MMKKGCYFVGNDTYNHIAFKSWAIKKFTPKFSNNDHDKQKLINMALSCLNNLLPEMFAT